MEVLGKNRGGGGGGKLFHVLALIPDSEDRIVPGSGRRWSFRPFLRRKVVISQEGTRGRILFWYLAAIPRKSSSCLAGLLAPTLPHPADTDLRYLRGRSRAWRGHGETKDSDCGSTGQPARPGEAAARGRAAPPQCWVSAPVGSHLRHHGLRQLRSQRPPVADSPLQRLAAGNPRA